MEMIVGTAREPIRDPTGAVVMRRNFSSCFSFMLLASFLSENCAGRSIFSVLYHRAVGKSMEEKRTGGRN